MKTERHGTAFDALAKIVGGHLGTPDGGQLELTTTFVDDLGADSLDIVDMVIDIEEEFQTEIDDDQVGDFKTIGDVIKWLEKNADLSGYQTEVVKE